MSLNLEGPGEKRVGGEANFLPQMNILLLVAMFRWPEVRNRKFKESKKVTHLPFPIVSLGPPTCGLCLCPTKVHPLPSFEWPSSSLPLSSQSKQSMNINLSVICHPHHCFKCVHRIFAPFDTRATSVSNCASERSENLLWPT